MCSSCFLNANFLFANWSLDIESGIVKSGYNDVRIPGKDGTNFSLKNDIFLKDSFFYRVEITNQKGFRFLYAPLTLEGDGILNRNINFNGKPFAKDTRVNALYQFNSYRLTYFKSFNPKENLKIDFGLTGKIRDARIKLKDNNQVSEKSNLGFVPLIYLNMNYKISDKWNILFGGDMLAAPQCRAEDILTAVSYQITPKIKLKTGYRFLEGGADNDEVYNFAFIHYFVAGANIEF